MTATNFFGAAALGSKRGLLRSGSWSATEAERREKGIGGGTGASGSTVDGG